MGKFGFAALGKRIKLSVFSFDVQPTIALGFALHWTWVWVTFWSSTFYSISPAPGPVTVGVPLEPLSERLHHSSPSPYRIKGERIRLPINQDILTVSNFISDLIDGLQFLLQGCG